MGFIEHGLQGLAQAVPATLLAGALFIVLALTVVFLTVRSRKRINALSANIDKRKSERGSLCDDSPDLKTQLMADVTILQQTVIGEAKHVLEAIRDGDMLPVQPLMTEALYNQYKDFDATTNPNFTRLRFGEISFIDSHVEQNTDTDGLWDLASFLLQVQANMEFRTTHNGLVLDNYNTPSTIYLRMVYVRNRASLVQAAHQICPICETPIYGASCIVCGHTTNNADMPTGRFLLTSIFTQNRRIKNG